MPIAQREPAKPTKSGPPASQPVKPWVDKVSGVTFQTAAIQQEDGRFVAIIVEQPAIRAVEKTQKAAEAAVRKKALELARTPVYLSDEEEDAIDIAYFKKMRRKWSKQTPVPLEELLRRLRA